MKTVIIKGFQIQIDYTLLRYNIETLTILNNTENIRKISRKTKKQ